MIICICGHSAMKHRLMATIYQHERICLEEKCECGGFESTNPLGVGYLGEPNDCPEHGRRT